MLDNRSMWTQALAQTVNPSARLRSWAVGAVIAPMCLLSAAQGVIVGLVTRIHDGDTVTVQQQDRSVVIRLASIDAPELAQPFGSQSREQLRACSFGRIAVIETRGTDRHGRVLGTLDAAGVDCGLQQLRAGLAWHYRYFANEQSNELRRQYSTAERDARQRAVGLWLQPDPTPPWTFRRSSPSDEQRATR